MNDSIPANGGLIIGSGDRVADLGKSGYLGLLLGVVLTALLGILYFALGPDGPAVIAGSWMVGWYLWLSVTMGMFGLSLLSHAIRPSWTIPLLRIWEAGGGPVNILLMGILFLPILINPSAIYEWANPNIVAHDAILQHKVAYLNQPFWVIRAFVWFGIWIALSGLMRRSTMRQDVSGDKRLERGRSSWGAFGMVVFFMTYTWALIDWLMSLDPQWYSTMHGLWQIVASALGGMSLAIAICCLNARREPYPEVISPNLTKDWGNMLFTNTMLWGYTGLSQYLIFWNGNLPDTTQYFARRSFQWWFFVGFLTIIGQFLVPWLSLLSPRIKRYPHLLFQIAVWIFCVHMIDAYIATAPALPTHAFSAMIPKTPYTAFSPYVETRAAGQYLWADILAFLAVGGFWLYSFSVQIRKAPILVKWDQRLQEAKTHAH